MSNKLMQNNLKKSLILTEPTFPRLLTQDSSEIISLEEVYEMAKSLSDNYPDNKFVNKFADFWKAYRNISEKNRLLAKKHELTWRLKYRTGIYAEAAIMAKKTYNRSRDNSIFEGWTESSDYSDLRYFDNETGFVSKLFQREKNGHREYMLATAGTRDFNDWMHNALQLWGESAQYRYSVEIAKKLHQQIKNNGGTLMFTGHSQGGGEALCNALATGNRAIVFNPAGVSQATKEQLGLTRLAEHVNKLVTTFIVDEDPLNIFQDASKIHPIVGQIPVAEGVRIYIKTRSATWHGHDMSGIVDAFIN